MERMLVIMLDIEESLTSQEHLSLLAFKRSRIEEHRTLTEFHLRSISQSQCFRFTFYRMFLHHRYSL